MTDGRFSGGSVGLVIGHVGPEAAIGGPIALIEDGDEIIVDLNKNDYKKLMNLAFKAHRLIGCTGVTRSDFKFYKKKFYLLEINTQPGMTKLSLVPEIAAYHGIRFIKLIEMILKDAVSKK